MHSILSVKHFSTYVRSKPKKNKEYKTITADDKAIAAITFFESIIF